MNETKEPRPRWATKEICEAVARELFAKLDMRGETGGEIGSALDRAAMIADIAAVILQQPYADGYALAKHLDEYHGWECNFLIAKTLNAAQELLDIELRRAEAAWAARNHIQPPLPVGVRCAALGVTGRIEAIFPLRPASYLIVRDVDLGGGASSRRMVVCFEDVAPLAAERDAGGDHV